MEVEGLEVQDKTLYHTAYDGVDNTLAWVVRAEGKDIFSCDEGLDARFVSEREGMVGGSEGFDWGENRGGDVGHTMV